MTTEIHTGYVRMPDGSIYLQLEADNRWGFVLADDDQTWPGGLGLAEGMYEWTAIPDDDPAVTDDDRERLQWCLDEWRAGLKHDRAASAS